MRQQCVYSGSENSCRRRSRLSLLAWIIIGQRLNLAALNLGVSIAGFFDDQMLESADEAVLYITLGRQIAINQ